MVILIHQEGVCTWKRHRAEMSRYHYKTDYVFTTHTGRLLDYSDVRRSLDRLYQRIRNDAAQTLIYFDLFIFFY